MVSLWYPAAPPDGPRARYMTPAESELQLTSRGITGVPPDVLSTVRTNAVSDATPAGIRRSLPLVVLSPGFTNSRQTLTALAEDLASHGIGADIPGARSLDITRAYVRAFFDQHLRGRPQTLLDQSSPRYPEVTFCSPGREAAG